MRVGQEVGLVKVSHSQPPFCFSLFFLIFSREPCVFALTNLNDGVGGEENCFGSICSEQCWSSEITLEFLAYFVRACLSSVKQ